MLRVCLSALCLCGVLWLAPRALADSDPSPWANTPGEDLALKLVTFGPGSSVHQYFGHNALIVEDTRRGVARMYNFGMFGFGPDMLPKYLQGQLEFWVAATPVRRTFRRYIEMDRSIHVQELDLTPAQRRALADRLAWYALPENRTYRYHHYRDNCSTKLRDLIDEVVGGQLKAQASGPARLNYRGHTWRYTEHDPIIHMLLILWMNDSMEQPIRRWDEAFLPNELERLVASARVRAPDGREHDLVKLAYTVYESPRAAVPEDPSRRWPAVLAVGVALGALAVGFALLWISSGRRLAAAPLGVLHVAVGLVCGVPGLVLFLFLFTQWKVTHWNENLLLVNPLTFAALPLGFGIAFGSRKAMRWMGRLWHILTLTSLVALAVKALPMFDQDNWLPMALLLPMNVGFAWASSAVTFGLPERPAKS
ncbi:MAG: DUF4105 domain-containing protein [Myxococcales bacterium]|jgi:hypothetical protein